VGGWLVEDLIDTVLGWFAGIVVGAVDLLWGLLSRTLFVVPEVTALPQVSTITATTVGVVNVAYVLAFLWVALLILGRDTVQSTYAAADLVPRLVVGLIAANSAVPVCEALIEVTNALTLALTGSDPSRAGSVEHLRDTTMPLLTESLTTGAAWQDPQASAGGFLLLLIGLLIGVLVVLLLVQWIVRLGLLVIAVGLAPLALACHGTPHTQGVAAVWWRVFAGSLATVVLQAFGLHTSLVVFLDPASDVTALGLPGDAGATLNLLVVACLLIGVVQIPAMMRRYLTRGTPGLTGQILRVVLIQRLTGRVRGLGLRRARLG
jgi:hypothetical protein